MLTVNPGKYECESLTFLYLLHFSGIEGGVGENFVRAKESYRLPSELWRVQAMCTPLRERKKP